MPVYSSMPECSPLDFRRSSNGVKQGDSGQRSKPAGLINLL